MANDSFQAFVDAIKLDPNVLQRLQRAPCLDTFLSEASQLGYAVNRRELQLWANHDFFDQDGWPWIGKSRQARMAFFRGERF